MENLDLKKVINKFKKLELKKVVQYFCRHLF